MNAFQSFIEFDGDMIPREGIKSVYIDTTGWWIWKKWKVHIDYHDPDDMCFEYSFGSLREAEACRENVKSQLGGKRRAA